MTITHEKRLAKLDAARIELDAQDTLRQAGQKIILPEWIAMLEQEAGSRAGGDSEPVHQMRVAIRRMRSALRLLRSYDVRDFDGARAPLQQVASQLGAVRDLDVLIENLEAYAPGLDENAQQTMQAIIARLDKRRTKAREKLIAGFDSKKYQKFVRDFSRQLRQSTPEYDPSATPEQLRHLLPVIIYSQLARVRAYDALMPDLTTDQLHALRIECKRLRYIVDFFQPVTGSTMGDFIEEIKKLQDILGRLNDITTAQYLLNDKKTTEAEQPQVDAYLQKIQSDADSELAHFDDAWTHFNGRSVQKRLSDALLVLR